VLLADVHAYLNEKGTMEEFKESVIDSTKSFIALDLMRKYNLCPWLIIPA